MAFLPVFGSDDSSPIKNVEFKQFIGESRTAAEILNATELEKSEKAVLNFMDQNGEIWIRLELEDIQPNSFLIVDNPLIDSLDFFQYSNGNLIYDFHTGDRYLFSKRGLAHPKFVFDLRKTESSNSTVLIRVKSEDQLFLPLAVETGGDLVWQLNNLNMIHGLFFGLIFVMFLYNLFIALLTKARNYFNYAFYILFFGLAQTALEGHFFMYVLPNSPGLFNHAAIFFSALAGIFGVLFTIGFIQVKEYAPKWLSGLYVFMAAYSVALIADLVGLKSVSVQILNVCALTIGIYIIIISAVVSSKGHRPAKFYLIAWSLFLVSLLLYVFRNLGFLPVIPIFNHILAIGSSTQVVLLSIALADRINILRREKEASQAEALQALQENEKIVREQNIVLEQKVDERTLELQEANEELTVTLANLRDTQTQLVDAEKMASLGQLTAGIAHEINNPINFVTSNIKPLERDLEEVYEIIDKYAESEEDQAKLADAHSLRKDLDYSYLKTEIQSLVGGISDGANRTSEIVKGLRTFSRLDEDAVKMADLHENLESTLVLLHSKMKDSSIEIKKEYGENIPELECYPGKLNQVFLNILNNAVYAVTEKKYKDGETASVIMRTSLDGDRAIIKIIDNGIGMDEETQRRMFDPFFTTKDVGEGTGLGMSIVYKIIEKHNAKISVESEEGKGSEFTISLPLQQPNESE